MARSRRNHGTGFTISLIWGLALIAVLFLLPAAADANAGRCDYRTGLGSFSAWNPPPPCWRPYSPSSPFNTPIGQGTPNLPGSSKFARSLTSNPGSGMEVFGDDARDGGVAVYWSKPNDPVYRLQCLKPWGTCALEGLNIRVPAQAQATGGKFSVGGTMDAHLTIVDQSTGWEYDMWNVHTKDDVSRVIRFGWGGKTRIDGDGLGSDAIAAQYGGLAGLIRPSEFTSGNINHALLLGVPCTETFVYPATKTGLLCTEAGLDPDAYPPMGARMQLDLTAEEIRQLKLPRWKKMIVRALARYGAYVSDTTGDADAWGFEYESGISYTSFGLSDPWVTWAKSLGVKPEDYNRNGQDEYWINLYQDMPWHRMRFVDVCSASRSCPASPSAPPTGHATHEPSVKPATSDRTVRRLNRRIRQCRAQRNLIARRASNAPRKARQRLRRGMRRQTLRCMRIRAVKKQHLKALRTRAG